MKPRTKKLIFIFSLVFSTGTSISAAPDRALTKELKRLEKKREDLQKEIVETKKSLNALKAVKDEVTEELKESEASFAKKFSDLLGPLLQWPEFSMNSTLRTWTEREHGQLVLEQTRRALIQEPILLMASRDLELKKATALHQQYDERVESLQQKQRVLSLQLEELKLLQKRSKRLRR